MQRTKYSEPVIKQNTEEIDNENHSELVMDPQHDPLLLSHATANKLLSYGHIGQSALLLYLTYYGICRWENVTDPIVLSNNSVMKRLDWGVSKFNMAKALLRKLELIGSDQDHTQEGKFGNGSLTIYKEYGSYNPILHGGKLKEHRVLFFNATVETNTRSTLLFHNKLYNIHSAQVESITPNSPIPDPLTPIPIPPSKEYKTTTQRSKEYLPHATRLASIVRSRINIQVNGTKLNSWANSIRGLVEIDGVNTDRISDALDWYDKHMGEDYVPDIQSGDSLRKKFLSLEKCIAIRAKNATRNPRMSNKPPKIMAYGKWYYLSEINGKYYTKDGQLLRDEKQHMYQ